MKTLITLLLLLVISPVFANTDSAKVEPELTKEVIYKDIKNVLSELGEALKVGSEHVYEVLVRQQIVNSITYAILTLAGILISIFTIKTALKTKRDRYGDLKEPVIFSIIVSIVIGIVSLIALFAWAADIVTGFVNPEYGAMKDIIEMLR